ncbi:hypothetical protein WI81_25075 [Burkholderia ubonensis]|nr:hypothetical protein WI81_25075 [Burkholderia ubonensis]KVU23579.1 hypothetical protein WK65_16855 [Burkholderia ubonensis]
MSGRGDFRDIAQQGDVLRAMVEFKRRNYRGDGLSARHVVLANVGQSEQAALDDIGRIFEVLMECFL